MADQPKGERAQAITIVISLKNNAGGLRETLQSIVGQAGADRLVILIADSNSSDFPIDVVREFEGSMNIMFLSAFDGGIYEAWNTAVSRVKTGWLTFFGSGDLMCGGAVAALVDAIDGEADFDILSSRSRNLYSNGVEEIRGSPFKYEEFSRFFSINHSGTLYRKSVFDQFGNFDARYRCSADYEFLIRVGKRVRFGFLDYVVSDYLVGGISSSSTLPLKETFAIRKKYKTVSTIENWGLRLRGIASFYYVKWFR